MRGQHPERLPALVKTPTDCLRCGACCFSPAEAFVRVTGPDWARLGDAAERLAHFIGHRAYMKMADGHCAALELRTTPAGGAGVFLHGLREPAADLPGPGPGLARV